MNTYKLIPLLFISFIFCQFNNVTVDIEYNKNDSNYHIKKNIIDGFDNQIKEYFLLNNFCLEFDFIQVDLKINLIIESINIITNNTGTTNQIISHLLISNNKDLYYFSKGIIFEYSKIIIIWIHFYISFFFFIIMKIRVSKFYSIFRPNK